MIMRHVFKKYTSNRGSALFMVISTMTALLISVMAMYFAMVSSRQTQYAVFNKMQASQTSQSIVNIVYQSIADPANHAAGGGVLLQQMKDLDVGESISTGANGFASLDPNSVTGLDESQLGAYSVTITRLPDKDGKLQYDVMVMSSVDGNRDAVHMTYGYSETTEYTPGEGEDGGGGDAELFAATGYVPNDAYISGGYYLTNVFYDTQFTYMNTFGGSGENRIGLDLSTGGDLMLGSDAMSVVHSASNDAISTEDVSKIGPVTWAIRGNFYPNLGSDMGMRGGSQILVGGDMIWPGANVGFAVKNDGYTGSVPTSDHVCIYVNGDFNYSGSDLKSNTWVFVNGNVTNIGWNKQTNARLFVTGTAEERAEKTKDLHTQTPVEEWKVSGEFAEGLTYDEAMELLGSKTQTIAYYKWDISGNTTTADTKHVDIRLNSTNNDWNDNGTVIPANQRNFIFAYDENADSAALIKKADGTGGNESGAIGKTFVIDSINTRNSGNGHKRGQTIIIDTGNDPDNIMTIKLNATAQETVNGETHDVFSWFPEDGNATTGFDVPDHKRLVLLKGRGTVLLDLPAGVTYEDATQQLTCHVGWFLIEGGKITEEEGYLDFSGIDQQGKYSAKIVPYIHKTCGEGDGCTFSTSESTSTCKECGNALTTVTCSVHGDVNKYCANCHPEKNDRKDWCVNHIDKGKFDSFYTTLAGNEKAAVTDASDNSIIYPSTNIMLVSCDESTEMRFSQTLNGSGISHNTFFGFLYAPYVSYLAAGGAQAGGLLKLCGGMTVGDYDIQAINAYIGCYPDKMPNELAGMAGGGNMSGGKLGGTTKSWKIEIGGYT